MDTITHGILGAAVSQAIFSRQLPRGAGTIGAVAAMAPDLDIFIRSANDPTVAWLFHRNFTHSLIFIPIGGLIAATPFLFMSRYRDQKKEVILASIFAYATHGLLDSLTNYGTQLFWPFSNYRVALDSIGIVDPIYSLILLLGVILTARRQQPRTARIALLLSSLYLCFGVWQHHRSLEAQGQLAAMRGHRIDRARVMPGPGWLLFWRSIYLANGRMYIDGIRTPWFSAPLVLQGGSANETAIEYLPASVQANAESRRRFRILNWFADGLIAPVENDANSIGDMRITAAVESMTPLWGLKFDPVTGEAQSWSPPEGVQRDFGRLIWGLFAGDSRYRSLK
ncbi:MAG: metal-dependent hydrolase [Blastocatellia bacterium]|nr:metal-dependent hydrolase [Blastocatellia bacterium]